MDSADLFDTSAEESQEVEQEEYTAAEVLQKLQVLIERELTL